MNDTPLRILLLEDRAVDAELVADELQRAGFWAELRRVEDEAAFCAAVDQWAPDVILADWTLPHFSGRAALTIARQRCPAVPFVFVSGQIEESAAIEAMRHGATDYVYKHQLDRLGPTLQRAFDEVEAQHALREREETYRSLFNNMLNGFAYCRMLFENGEPRDFVYLTVNPAFERQTGLKDVVGKRVTEVIPGIRKSDPQLFEIYARVALTGQPESCEYYVGALQMWFSISVYCPKREHFVAVFEAITERKLAEIGLRRLNRALRTISRCNEVLVRATDENELLQDMCRTIVEVGQHPFAWVGYPEQDAAKSVRAIARFGTDDGFLDQAAITWADVERGQGPTGTAIRTGTTQVNQNFADDPRLAPWRDEALKRGYAGSIALPLSDETGTFSALTIYAGEADAFDVQEVELLTELASDLGYGINSLRIRAERDQALRDLQLAAKVFEDSKEGIFITNAEKRILAVNRCFTTITGYRESEVLGHKPSLIDSERHDASFIDNLWASVDQGGHWMGEVWNRRKGGEVFPVLQSVSAVRDEGGVLTHYVAILSDISERKESEERIRYLTQHDALTGLANRTLLTDRLEQAIAYARRTGRLVGVMLLDLDCFKLINDSLGHATGDLLLKQVADRLSGHTRAGDTVARLGGDEFMLVLSDIGTENDLASLARHLVGALTAPMTVDGKDVTMTASLGVALFPRDGEVAAALLQNADAAMYRAKELGRNTIQFYAPEMNARMLERFELESGLRRAIERCEFVLQYQPKVELIQGQVIGAEALIRWCHPALGMVSPGDFIPLAEETGLIIPIGDWVIETACRQLKSWHNQGFSDLAVSVNLSARQFQQENLVDFVAGVLAANDLQAQYLELEVTESAVMRNPEQTIDTLQRLKKLGVHISLDDFGTGYSSLNYLKRFPIDVLKIDQSFVRDITSDPGDAAIANAVISLAHNLKHKVIAEGTETEAQVAFLRRNHCDQIQGYCFSRPLPVEEFQLLLRSGKTLYLGQESEGIPGRTLLIVDDEQNILASLRRLLRRDRYRILSASSAAEAFELLAINEVQVVVSDQRMPQMCGTEFLSRVKEMYPDTIRLVLSGYTELQSITDAINRGAIYKFLAKPWDDQLLREHIEEAFIFYESKHQRRYSLIPG